MVALLVLAAAYLTFVNTAFWIWVANSAFRGIREEQDIGLGIQCVVMTISPLVGAFAAYRIRRARRSRRRGMARAAATIVVLQVVSALYAVVLQGPF